MSNRRTSSSRKQASKERLAKRRAPKGAQKPEVDLEKKRATVAQISRVYSTLEGRIAGFEKKATSAVQQLFANEQELKSGMSSAEFNLRAHQKVINAICLELDRFRMMFQAILPPEQKDILKESIVQMSDVTLPSEEEGGDPVVVRRPNWPYYHGQVEKDLKILAALEAQAQAEAKVVAEKAEAERLAAQSEKIEADLEAEAVMDSGEMVELPAEIEEGAKEEAQNEPPQDGEFPEDAAIFGG